MPADAVVYDETPDGAAKLLALGPEYGPPGRPLFNTADSRPPPGWIPPAEYHPQVLWKIHPQRRRRGVVLLHERTTEGGMTRVVVITAGSSAWGRPPKKYTDLGRMVGLGAELLAPPGWRTGFGPQAKSLAGDWDVPLNHDQRIRVFAGQPDPDDASHFTIEYEIVGENRRRTLDGWVRDEGFGPAATRPWHKGPSVEFRERTSEDRKPR
jgi:hypothetical protein